MWNSPLSLRRILRHLISRIGASQGTGILPVMKAMILLAMVVLVGGCASTSIQSPIVEKVIRMSLKKPTGELTKADLKRVTGLDLYRTNIPEAGLKEIAKLKQLIVLGLSRSNISDMGLKELTKCKKLEGLSLDSTQISDAGLKWLTKLAQLKGLRVQQTKVTKAGVVELQKALPNCLIIHNAKK